MAAFLPPRLKPGDKSRNCQQSRHKAQSTQKLTTKGTIDSCIRGQGKHEDYAKQYFFWSASFEGVRQFDLPEVRGREVATSAA